MPLGAFKAALMGSAGVSTGSVVLLHDTDYSNAATASITSGIDSTYGEYIFRFYNVNPATDNVFFEFQGSIDGGSNYNVTATTSAFRAHHDEADSSTGLVVDATQDRAQQTTFIPLTAGGLGNGADESASGELHLFNPSSTTYVKHFYSRGNTYHTSNFFYDFFMAGYFNDGDDDINAVQFKMSSGNFDGTIKMWGVK